MSKIKIHPQGKERNPVPSPFELSVIATLLAKGKEKPEDKLEAAWDLFNEAQSLIYFQEEEFSDVVDEFRHREAEWEWEQKMKKCVMFWPKKPKDPAREYLDKKGHPIKTPKAFIRNLRPIFIRNWNKSLSEDKASDYFLQKINQGELPVPMRYLDELVEIKRAKKREGGKKSYETRKRNSVKHHGKK